MLFLFLGWRGYWLLFLLGERVHSVRRTAYTKKRQSQKTLSLAMPQLVGVPGFEGRSPREDTAEKINPYYPRNRINRESHAVKHCNTSRRLVLWGGRATCGNLFTLVRRTDSTKKRQSQKNSVVSNAPTCRGTRIRTWDPLLPKQMR